MKDGAHMERAAEFKSPAKLMGALAHPIRLGVLSQLLDGPAIVTDLVNHFGEDQTKISKHLAILRNAGLVACQADGRCRIYSLADEETVRKIMDCLTKLQPSVA
jgi:DNA-binding transcriptional ArsR family regulator